MKIKGHGSLPRIRQLLWETSPPSRRLLRGQGFHVLDYPRLRAAVARVRPGTAIRSSLRNPAARVLAVFDRHPRVAILGVGCSDLDDLRLVYGYILEPAFRRGCTLLIGADRPLQALDRRHFVEEEWGCPWTLERLLHLAERFATPVQVPWPEPVPRWRHWLRRLFRQWGTSPQPAARLDPQQNAAVTAGDGVVQVIAPAGSGKTTVLIERVRELHRRGTAPERILCSTFNRDACEEIAARLEAAGIKGICVRSFHGLGLSILKQEGRLRKHLGNLDQARWDELAELAAAAEPGCPAFDGSAAQEAVGAFKLATMITPEAAIARAANEEPVQRAAARVFQLYEELQEREERHDLDDLICESIRLLQAEAAVRRRWQDRFERVLVDEYQDIEPAQALLIGLLAAPHDSLFCVGDEDQCIYAWRRASVQRVIDLDQVYPGLERYPLVRNYRCGRLITHASRRLIRHNRRRFSKPLHSGVPSPGNITVWPQTSTRAGAVQVARLLRDARPGKVAVLARTGNLLRTVAEACGWSPGSDGGEAGVTLATVHGSKGREWDHVILFGADQGQFPLIRASDPLQTEILEDERRLFYVALTRARTRLDIVCNRRRPSQFLGEAGLAVR